MSTETTKTLTRGAPDPAVAWRAVERFQPMLGNLSQLASAVAGKQLIVKISKQTELNQTYDNIIELAPPYNLGLDIPHDFSLCNTYTWSGKPNCPACEVYEDILTRIYHELGHHLGESFATNSNGKTAGQVALSESPYLKTLLNIVDDARCNYSIVQVRPGLARIIHSNIQEMINASGIGHLGTDVQLMFVANCDAEGLIYRVEDVHPSVLLVQQDPEWERHVSSWQRLTSSWETLSAARKFLQFCQRHNFFLTEDEYNLKHPQPEQPAEPEPSQQEETDDVPTAPEDITEPEPEADGNAESQDREKGSGSGSEDSQESYEDEEAKYAGGDPSDEDDSNSGNEASDDQDETSSEPGTEGEPQPDVDEQADEAEGGVPSGDNSSEDPGVGEDEAEDSGDSVGDDVEPEGDYTEDRSNGSDDEGDSASEYNDDQAGEDSQGDASGDHDSQPGTGELAASSTDTPDNGTATHEHGDDTGTTDAPTARVGPGAGTPDDGTPDGTDPATDATEPDPEGLPNDLVPTYQDWQEEHGSADEVAEHADEMLSHGDHSSDDQTPGQDKAVETAVDQHEFFDAPSKRVAKVVTGKYEGTWVGSGLDNVDQRTEEYMRASMREVAAGNDVITPNVQKLKYVFAENDRAGKEEQRKSGKVNARALGKRAPVGDQRLFYKKTQPKKRDYTVVIGIDVTGSTYGDTLRDEKAAALAMCQMLDRLHIPFVVYAHSGNGRYTYVGNKYKAEYYLAIYEVKSAKQQWQPSVIDALGSLPSDGGNFDGHALQYLRKRAEEFRTTDKLIMYFSDGSMFSNDSEEQSRIFQDELDICKRKHIAVTVVEVQNDEAEALGVQTVRYDNPSDIPRVIQHVARQLEGR